MSESANDRISMGPDQRDERLAELVDKAEHEMLATGQPLDVEAFLRKEASSPADWGILDELRELIDMVAALRAGSSGVISQAPPATLERIGSYEVLREIGRGGMGVVYLAQDHRLDRQVALKVLPGIARTDESLRQRFEAESRAIARLTHPNIIPLYDAGEVDGYLYLAMQYVQGQTLEQLVESMSRRGDRPRREGTTTSAPGLSFRQVARIVRDLGRALEHAHQSGILHRDVKTGNVILDELGKPWMLDFGVCRLTEGEGVTRTGSVLGTLRTMAPEQIDGASDQRSDVYGLGLILYELLTTQRAFDAGRSSALVRAIQSDEPRRPRRIDSRIPVDLETIARKAYAKVPSERYPAASALSDDLDAFIEGRAIAARPPSALYLAKLLASRHRGVAMVLAASLAAITALGVRFVSAIATERDLARAEAYEARVAAADAALAHGEVGRALEQLEAAPDEYAGWEREHLAVRADQALAWWRPLSNSVSPLRHVHFSPSGGEVLVASMEGYATLVPGEASGPWDVRSIRVEGATALDNVESAAWLSDGSGWWIGTWPREIRLIRPDAIGEDLAIDIAFEAEYLSAAGRGTALAATTAGELIGWEADAGTVRRYNVSEGKLHWCASGDVSSISCGVPTYWGITDSGTFVGVDPASGDTVHRVELGENDGKLQLLNADLTLGTAFVADFNGAVRRVDLATGETVQRLQSPGGRVTSGAILGGGDRLFSGAPSSEFVNVHDLATGELVDRLSGHSSPISAMAASDDAGLIMTADDAGMLAAWDPHFHSGVTTLRGHENDVWAAAAHDDGRRLATAGRDGLVIVWDLETHSPWRVFREPALGVQCLDFIEGEGLLVGGSKDGHVYLFDLEAGEERARVDPGHGEIHGAVTSPDEDLIYVSTGRGLLTFGLDLEPVTELVEHPVGFGALIVSESGRYLYSTREARTLEDEGRGAVAAVDLERGEVIWETALRTSGMPSVDISSDESLIASVVDETSVAFLDATTGQVSRTLELPGGVRARDVLLRVAFGPGENRLVASSTQGAVYMFDVEREALILELNAHRRWVTALTVDGGRVVTGGSDRKVRVWHHSSALEMRTAARNSGAMGDPSIAAEHRERLGRSSLLTWAWDHLSSPERHRYRSAVALVASWQRRTRYAAVDPETVALEGLWSLRRNQPVTASQKLSWALDRMGDDSSNFGAAADALLRSQLRQKDWRSAGLTLLRIGLWALKTAVSNTAAKR